MELAQTYDYLSDVELDVGLRELLLLIQQLVQVTSINVRHDEVQTNISLEEVLHPAQERVLCL